MLQLIWWAETGWWRPRTTSALTLMVLTCCAGMCACEGSSELLQWQKWVQWKLVCVVTVPGRFLCWTNWAFCWRYWSNLSVLFLSCGFSSLSTCSHLSHTVLKLLNLYKILCNSFRVLNLSIKNKFCGLDLFCCDSAAVSYQSHSVWLNIVSLTEPKCSAAWTVWRVLHLHRDMVLSSWVMALFSTNSDNTKTLHLTQ